MKKPFKPSDKDQSKDNKKIPEIQQVYKCLNRNKPKTARQVAEETGIWINKTLCLILIF